MIRLTLALFTILLPLQACSGSPEPIATDHANATGDWPAYGAAPGGGRFSSANQITVANVGQLEPAWVYRSGDLRQATEAEPGEAIPTLASSWQMTPLLVKNTLYGCTAFNDVFALDPTTGEERWRFRADVDISGEKLVNCRGVSSWQDATVTGQCSHRIITATMDSRLIALNAETGKPCTDFGDGGTVDLTQGIGEHLSFEYASLSPPAVIGDRVIVGSMVLDRVHNNMPSGVVRAFDVRSGEMLWYWDPIPPGQEPVVDEQGQPQFQRGTTNVWSIISVDEERDLVFLPTGNTSTDFFGGLRNNIDYWSSSVVALRGSTGEVVWHFQMVHHDIWDYDTPSQPTLFEFERDGESIPALAQPTKMGHLYLLNRETGEPLFPVEERPVPQDYAVPGEYLSPTQPFPTRPPPLHPQRLEADDAWGLTPWDRGACRDLITSLRNEGIYTPPSLEGSVFYPSDFGGNNWDSPAIDPGRNIAVLNTRFVPAILKLIPREDCGDDPAKLSGPQFGTPYCLDLQPMLSPLGMPCVAPPWGTLTAVDLNAGEVLWEVPLGNFEHVAPWPISRLMQGPPNIGGPAVTASGLVFIAGTPDQYLRAFNTLTGEELWRAKLPTGGHANPMTFRSKGGKQYVVIAAGGHFGMTAFGQEPGDYLMAFALPD